MMAQVEAGLPVLSESMPAMMPPMIPPTSKIVDNMAASSASTWNFKIINHDTECQVLKNNLVHDMNIVGQPVEEGVGNQFGKKQAEKLVEYRLKVSFLTLWKIQQLQEWRELQQS